MSDPAGFSSDERSSKNDPNSLFLSHAGIAASCSRGTSAGTNSSSGHASLSGTVCRGLGASSAEARSVAEPMPRRAGSNSSAPYFSASSDTRTGEMAGCSFCARQQERTGHTPGPARETCHELPPNGDAQTEDLKDIFSTSHPGVIKNRGAAGYANHMLQPNQPQSRAPHRTKSDAMGSYRAVHT